MAEQIGPSGTLLSLFDGRLDNRSELIQTLASSLMAPSDADVALLAYGRWGEDFPNHLIGDYACAIWDGAAGRLILARDAMGALPLVFWRHGDMLFFATEPRGLLAQPEIPKAVDPRWIARWLALLPQNETATQYQGIEKVPPGQVVIHDQQGVRLHRFWRPETLTPLRFERDADYEAGLRSVLEEAIRCRIGTSGTIGSHLSGGLDSSSVAALAAGLIAPAGRRLAAFTAVPTGTFDPDDFPGRFCDEGQFAAQTAARFPNIDHVLIPNDASPVFDAVDRASVAMDGPVLNPYNQIWGSAIAQAASARGIKLLLTGQMGNMTISFDGLPRLKQLVQAFHWGRWLHEVIALHRHGHTRLGLADLSFGWALPPASIDWLRNKLGRPRTKLEDFSALTLAYAERVGVADEARAMGGNVGNTELGQRDVRLAVLGRGDPALNRLGVKRQFGIDMVDPTRDRRVVEFCLAVPLDQYLRHGETRSLIRRAMRGILPSAVVNERRKGLQAVDWHVAATAARAEMAAEIERLERSPLGRECLDLPRLRRLVDDWPTGGWHRRRTIQSYQLALARGLAAGRFIRRVEGGNS